MTIFLSFESKTKGNVINILWYRLLCIIKDSLSLEMDFSIKIFAPNFGTDW